MRKKDRVYTIIRSGLQGRALSDKLLGTGLKLGVRTVGPDNEVQISFAKTWIPASEWAKAYHNDLQIEMQGMLERFREMNEPIATQSERTQRHFDWTEISKQVDDIVTEHNKQRMRNAIELMSGHNGAALAVSYIRKLVES